LPSGAGVTESASAIEATKGTLNMQPPKLQPGDLTKDELLWIVEHIVNALWPRGDSEFSWSPDTVESVASILDQYHLRP
jgi:hypothetical protein